MSNHVILIPAYKPGQAMLDVIDSLLPYGYTVVVVNDGSGDEYLPVFEEASKNATVLHQNPNRGKGAALKYGIAYIRDHIPSCDGIITVDADGQHKSCDVAAVSKELENGQGLVLGVRKFEGKVPFRSRFGNSITKLVFMIAAGKKCGDTQTGLRGFTPELFDTMLSIKGNRYEYEMNMLMYTAQNGFSIREVPIATVYENNNESSHFRPIVDSFHIYKIIFMNSQLIRSGLSAIFCFILDFTCLLLFNKLFDAILPKGFVLPASVIATVLARLISSPINYLINRNWVFNSNASKAASFISYILLASFSLGVKSGLMYLLEHVLEINIALADICIEFVIFIFNFTVQKLFIFKDKK